MPRAQLHALAARRSIVQITINRYQGEDDDDTMTSLTIEPRHRHSVPSGSLPIRRLNGTWSNKSACYAAEQGGACTYAGANTSEANMCV